MKRLNALAVAGYVRGASFIRNLKRDERGLSGIVVAVLLILVSVLAIVLLWDLLGKWISDLWDTITGTADKLT